MSATKATVQKALIAAAGAALLALCMAGPASARHGGSIYDRPDARPLADWEVFGFDLSSVPDDAASLAAFKASLDPRTLQGVENRCKYDIIGQPNRYSPKIRTFCFGS